MTIPSQAGERLPLLPKPLSLPLKLLPRGVHQRVLVTALNRVFVNELETGELDFLEQRSVAIEVSDMRLSYRLTMQNGKLVADGNAASELTVRAALYDFMLLASRQVDPDTLVFRRRLVMEGDTELGLALKNFLDSVDVDDSKMLTALESLSKKALPVYQRLFGQ